jgi:hypothetical protein
MRTRIALALGLLAALPSAGCSSVRIAYESASWFLVRELDKALCLEREQRAALRRSVDGFLRWHRQHELPRYSELLRRIARGLEKPVTRALLRETIDGLDQARRRAVQVAEAPLLRFGMSLGGRQAGCLAVAVARRRAENERDERANPEAHAARERRKLSERLEDWVGELSASQRALVARLTPSRDEAAAVSRARLNKWMRLVSALASRDPARKRGWLRAWIVEADGLYSEEERALIRRERTANEARLWQLLQTLDASQRGRLARKLGGYAADLEALAPRARKDAPTARRARER